MRRGGTLLAILLLTSIVGIALVGCESGKTTSPLAPGGAIRTRPDLSSIDARGRSTAEMGGFHFYPLDLGNQWHTSHVFQVDVEEDGQSDPGFPLVIHSQIERSLIGIEHRNGKDYVVEHSRIQEEDVSEPFDQWVRYREDRSGLYEADISILEPPILGANSRVALREGDNGLFPRWEMAPSSIREGPNATAFQEAWNRMAREVATVHASLRGDGNGAVMPAQPDSDSGHELSRFLYPLRPGGSWVIRAEDPTFVSTVEAVEVLTLPAGRFVAYRIRNTFPAPDSKASILLWYGRQGFLKLDAHFESEARDPSGNPVGTIVSEEREVLEDLHLVGGGS